MTTLSASSSRPADTGFAVAATLVAGALFLVGWGVLHRGFFTHDRIIDTPVYERYGSAIDSGQVPYRDFALEYPPGALPVFALPALGGAHGDTFRRRFEAEMAFLGLVIVICVRRCARGTRRRQAAAARRARVRRRRRGCARPCRALALRPLARRAHCRRPRRAPQRAAAARARGARRGGGREAVPGGARADHDRLRLEARGQTGGARLRRAAARCPGRGVRPVHRARAARRLGELLEPGVEASADREPGRCAPPRRPPRLRVRPDDGLEPRLPEPRRSGAGRARGRALGAPARRADRDLDPVRARPRDARADAPGERRRPRRLRRAREGALAAVPDLADPGRPARPRAARADRIGPSRGRARSSRSSGSRTATGTWRSTSACWSRGSCSRATCCSSRCSPSSLAG